MNQYVKNLERIEFVVTYACTGRCKHCSEGEHVSEGEYVDAGIAARVVEKVSDKYSIESVMTFGGEPLLHQEAIYAIHAAAKEMNIPKRQLITNGFFSKDPEKIKAVAENLAQSGVNDICLSVDAFHQETIPLDPVKQFAMEVKRCGVPVKVHPAWLVAVDDDNTYNQRTRELLAEFEEMGIEYSEGNVIFPSGNALKYLGEYFDKEKEYVNPYEEDVEDIRAISIEPNGNVLGGNVYKTDILEILEKYEPKK